MFQLSATYVKKFVYSMEAHAKNRNNLFLTMSYKFAPDVSQTFALNQGHPGVNTKKKMHNVWEKTVTALICTTNKLFI
jgi:hypothetical protein